MATKRHTIRHEKTQVEMNDIVIRRTRLSKAEKETARLMFAARVEQHIIAAHFGINQGRINEMFKNEPPPPPPPNLQTAMDV